MGSGWIEWSRSQAVSVAADTFFPDLCTSVCLHTILYMQRINPHSAAVAVRVHWPNLYTEPNWNLRGTYLTSACLRSDPCTKRRASLDNLMMWVTVCVTIAQNRRPKHDIRRQKHAKTLLLLITHIITLSYTTISLLWGKQQTWGKALKVCKHLHGHGMVMWSWQGKNMVQHCAKFFTLFISFALLGQIQHASSTRLVQHLFLKCPLSPSWCSHQHGHEASDKKNNKTNEHIQVVSSTYT